MQEDTSISVSRSGIHLPRFIVGRSAIFIAAGVWVLVVTGVSFGTHAYVVNLAEQDISAMLLQHKGVHQYIQKIAHPEMNSLKKNHEIPEALYSPVLFSSSFMVRNMHALYNEERKKAGLKELYYKMAADNPRNPVNLADARERQLIERFNRDRNLKHVDEIIEENGKKYLYVAVPFLANEARCLLCHGKREDAPKNLQERYPLEGGFDETVGRIRAIESLKAPLQGEWTIPLVMLLSTTFFGLSLLVLSGINRRLKMAVRNRTETIASQAQAILLDQTRLRITLESIGDGVISVDVNGRIMQMNRVASQLTGRSESEASGRPVEEVLHFHFADTNTSDENPLRQVLGRPDTSAVSGRCTMYRPNDHRQFKVSFNASPILDVQNTVVGGVLVFKDITEQTELEERLRQSEKMDAIGRLAGGVAHDFNNMLGGIIGAAELMTDELPKDSPAYSRLQVVLSSAERAAELTGSLLTFSRKNRSELTPVDLHSAIRETVTLLKHTLDRRITIILRLDAKQSCMQGNLAILENILINLGINAGHAMQDGGSLTFTTRDIAKPAEDALNEDGIPVETIELIVQDTGSGISPLDLPHIFEPFFTTRSASGTGLGLAAAYGAVITHRGTIAVESNVGQGTRFVLRFPVFKSPCPNINWESSPSITGEGTILVVDDEPSIRNFVSTSLETAGYRVLVADNGADAVEIYKHHTGAIDLVLLDMVMPVMNGADCFRSIRRLDPDACVAVVSGYTENDDLPKLKAEGVAGFISKPFRRRELLQFIERSIASRRELVGRT